MKCKTVIKTYSPGRIKSIVKIIVLIAFSLLLGFAIAFFGKNKSYVEESFITISLTLLGFDLTSVVFMCGAIQNIKASDEQISALLNEIAEDLGGILCAVLISIGLDFLASIIQNSCIVNLALRTLKFASLSFSLGLQLDVIKAFLRIVKIKSSIKSEELPKSK